MPAKGYSTVGLKPAIFSRLQEVTDRNYPGMFLPSTLIILMNEIKRGHYSVESHKIRLDLSGHYNTMTIRLDIQQWLEENYKKLAEEYEQKYGVKCFTSFVSYFIINILESKFKSQNHCINLKESEFEWLQKEYKKQKNNQKNFHEIPSFERFADSYINNLFEKIKAAKEILTT
ncbi:hypothetical protein [Nitrosopumilus sp. S4]